MELKAVVEKMKNRGFLAEYCRNAEEARARALEIIGSRSVGIGGSVTVRTLGIADALKEKNIPVYWHWLVDKSETKAERGRAIAADVYMCSANALLEDGRIVNVDGTGNRAAGVIYGPDTVIMVIGKNKLVAGSSIDEAITRVKNSACAKNAIRQGFDTPCAKTGKCVDCRCPQRMCCVTFIHETPLKCQKAFHVLLVDEELGL